MAEASKESKLLKLKMLAPKFNKSAMGSSMQQRVTELEAENMALRQQVTAATTPRGPKKRTK